MEQTPTWIVKRSSLFQWLRWGCGTVMEETDLNFTTGSINPATHLRLGTFFHIPPCQPHVIQ